MNCQEVMELMQRYIDGDLDQRETSLMMDHTEQCPDCAAMFVRLKKLSSELEQLPRVVPKFSIVDSILPELERLHAAETTESPVAEPYAPEDKPANGTPSRSNRPSRHLVRKISGVVAAGIVVGLLLFGKPDQWLLGGSKSENDAAMPAPAAAEAPQGLTSQSSEASDNARKAAPQMNDQFGVMESLPEVKNMTGGEAVAPDEGGTRVNPTMKSDGGAPGEAPAVGDVNSFSAESVPAERADSPDGKWMAIAASGAGAFQIVRNEDGSTLYVSEPREGRIGLLQWNAESTLLYFTVRDADGTGTEWQFDVAALKESQR